MELLKIYSMYHSILKEKSIDVDEITTELQEFALSMIHTMHNADGGVGLAANQVGDRRSIFVMDFYDDEEDEYVAIAVINPQIIEESEEMEVAKEGCLSAPDCYVKIKRPTSIKVSYLDTQGNEITTWMRGFNARVFYHEFDHLKGIQHIEKASPMSRMSVSQELEKVKRGYLNVSYPMVHENGKVYEPEL